MPDHTFDGPGPHTYTSSKDAARISIGTVEPGEIRDTDGPLDHMWRETTDEDRARGQGGESSQTPSPPLPRRSARTQAAPLAADDKTQEG